MWNDTYEIDFWDYFDATEPSEASAASVPAPDQGFVLVLYSVLLGTGAVGNVAVFASLLRSRRRKSRVNLLMTHLAVADLIVICVIIPLEIGWRTTNAWMAGNLACKFFLVLRAFGLYLSSNILVCISLDRFFAVLYPLRLAVARSRSKTMLCFAWFIALFCSLPQSLVFRVLRHPEVPEFQQCVAFDAFPSHRQELAYNVFCLCAMYFLPLLIITVCYGCIFYEISKNSKEISDKNVSDHSRIQLRRSDRRPLARARRRTLRMTVTIVAVFACCWMPYATMTLWYMVDRQSAKHVSARLQDLFFVMAVSNSCMDPLVYGTYALNLKAIFTKTFKKIFCIHATSNEITRISAHATLKTKLPTNDLHPAPVQCSSVRRHRVRFQETSLGGPSVTSDPVRCWRDHSDEDQKIKPSRSCEVFTLQTPRDYY
ncbi:adipokinetic hormone/corazonin-related peptide receptor variant I-like [Cydia fagiglandana]|uniref:adipokinetic hormone/corazonin-related peptide receptor variant I-like n=1 Tax=Cydia fagiglandana TaxID=1458189 RepID=UPI002FEE1144